MADKLQETFAVENPLQNVNSESFLPPHDKI